MSKKKSKLSNIGEKINKLLAPKQLLDPEYNSDDETVAKTRYYDSEDELEHQPAAPLSHIRKKNVRLLQDIDAKYSGKITSRKEMEMSSEYEESSESEADTGGLTMKELDSDDGDGGNDTEDERVDDDGSKDTDEEDEAFADEEQQSQSEESEVGEGEDEGEEESDFEGGDIMPQKVDKSVEIDEEEGGEEDGEKEDADDDKKLQISKDIEKGMSIQNQLHIWEKLLEIRIHSQKVLLKANSLPQGNYFKQLTSHSQFNEEVQKTSTNVENLLTKMCALQKALVNQFPEMKEIKTKRKRTEVGDEVDRVGKIAKRLEDDYVDFKDYRNATISKWYDRTKILTPGSSKSSKQPTFDIIRNIEGGLSNKDELVKRTQLQKGGYEIIGMEKRNEDSEPMHCAEIYDDTDFYHSQLRELIEFKTNTSTNPAEMAKQFVELQKLRNKIKKVVDTRASKGRKIRYAVHNKMVNFMARNDPTEWSDEAKTELFSSLFGSQMGG